MQKCVGEAMHTFLLAKICQGRLWARESYDEGWRERILDRC